MHNSDTIQCCSTRNKHDGHFPPVLIHLNQIMNVPSLWTRLEARNVMNGAILDEHVNINTARISLHILWAGWWLAKMINRAMKLSGWHNEWNCAHFCVHIECLCWMLVLHMFVRHRKRLAYAYLGFMPNITWNNRQSNEKTTLHTHKHMHAHISTLPYQTSNN